MTVGKQIRISLVGSSLAAVVDLFDEPNGTIAEAIWEAAPYRTLSLHNVVSGKNMYSFRPVVEPNFGFSPQTTRRMAAAPGTLFCSYPRVILIKYGEDSEDHSWPAVGRVRTEDLGAAQEIGRRTWEGMFHTKEIVELHFDRVGEIKPEQRFQDRLLDPGRMSDPRLASLLARTNEAIENIWVRPPPELLRLFDGTVSRETGMGSYGQYFSTLFFAESESSRLSNVANCGALDNLLRLCRNEQFELTPLKLATASLCRLSATYLRMCGQETIGGLMLEAIDNLDRFKTKDEYFDFFSTFTLYALRFHSWNMQLFPWRQGEAWSYQQRGEPAKRAG